MPRRPLFIRRLFDLKPGDRYVVYWAKDDDHQDVRLDHVTQTVASNDSTTLQPTDDGYEWYLEECDRLDPEHNMLDTGRGYAYFYVAEM